MSHSSIHATRVALAAATLFAGCAVAPDSTITVDAADPAIAALLAAEPGDWIERLPPVHSLGSAATAPLVQALQQQPEAAGGPAAVALLGRIGSPLAVPFLTRCIEDRSQLATEAALALGELGPRLRTPPAAARPLPAATMGVLRTCALDPSADATLRTAAAIAMVHNGERTAAAPLLRAVLLGGTPAGASLERELGLPVRPRWALERYMVKRMLVQHGAQQLADALDPDAPWPVLAAVTERIAEWLQRRDPR